MRDEGAQELYVGFLTLIRLPIFYRPKGFTFSVDTDGILQLTIGDITVVDKTDHGRREMSGSIELKSRQSYPVKIG